MKLKKKSKTTSKKVHQEKKRSLAVKKKEKKNQANSNAKQQKKLKRGNDPQEGKPSKKQQRRMSDEKATTEKQLKLKRKSRGQQSTDGENSAPAKEEPNAKTENKDAMSTKKRRRPWRQAIRHKAKRERVETEQQQLEENSLNSQTTENQENNDSSSDNQPDESDDDEPTIENEEDSAQKKPKKRSRAKRLRQKQRLMAGLQNGEGSEEHGEQQMSSSKTAGNGVDQRLDASRFRFINEQLYTQPSSSAAQLFADDPAAFDAYHRGYKQQLKKWPANPLLTLALDLASLPRGSVVADLGCGEAELARLLLESSAGSGPNKNDGDGKKQQPPKLVVHSFDLVAANKRVVAADMANLPLENGSVDVCVFCLSLMGTNLAQFFREAHRILKMGGKVKIAEVTSRFQNVNVFVAALTKLGFQLKRKKEIGNGFFTMLSLQKVGKIENKRPLGLQLQPCLYKKR